MMETTETKAAQPAVFHYPRCPKCKTAYALRRAMLIMKGRSEWVWARDCKCREHLVAEIVKEDGR